MQKASNDGHRGWSVSRCRFILPTMPLAAAVGRPVTGFPRPTGKDFHFGGSMLELRNISKFWNTRHSCHLNGVEWWIAIIQWDSNLFSAMYVCMYGWMDGWMDGCMYVCMYACMHVCMYVCMCKYTHTHVHIYIHTHVHIHIHIYIYMYIHTYIYICIYISTIYSIYIYG